MLKLVHATVTLPPALENVAVPPTAGEVVVVVDAEGFAAGFVVGGAAVGTVGLIAGPNAGPDGAPLRPPETVVAGLPAGDADEGGTDAEERGLDDDVAVAGAVAVVVVVAELDELPFRATTTSWWATTGAGRSVTSAATNDTAAHTMSVAVMVMPSQSPAASNRRTIATVPHGALAAG